MAIVTMVRPASLRALRLSLVTVVFTLFLATVTSQFAHAEKPLSTVADLRYGATLYEYYLGDFFQALSELMVAEQRGGIQGHGDNPKLIEGGISLSFGMERKAGDVFAELLSANEAGEFSRPLEVRNSAWFYLGKLRYLRGDWNGTEESFARITGEFDQQLVAELEALVINLSIRRDELDQAITNLEKTRNAEEWLPYLYFNLGNAYSRNQNFAEAVKYYQRLVELPLSPEPVQREEQLILFDKAYTAAGYSYILQGLQEQAINQFTQVRLDSPYANRALLGYGWAAAENEQYELALKPWQELSQRSLVYASTQEAVIAVPFAYEQLGAKGQALQSYLSAELAFQKEIARIESVIAELENLDLLEALNIDENDERNWFKLNEEAVANPRLTYLTELFSLNLFQGSVQELRDLMTMQDSLLQWREKIDAYAYMLDQREINRTTQMQKIADYRLGEQLAAMKVKRNALDKRLNEIVAQQDYFALAEGDAKEFIGIVKQMEVTISRLRAAGEPVTNFEQQLRRYKGLLLWEGSEAFTDQTWELRSAINSLDAAIADASANLERLERVVVEAPDIAPYRTRMAALDQRLGYESGRVDAAVNVATTKLRERVSNELAKQKGRLHHYQSQARLSVARLYDAAALGVPLE